MTCADERAARTADTLGRAETLVAVRGCLPAVAVAIDARGTVVHWGPGARALFGHRRRDALGAPASELLPVVGALNASAHPGDHHWLHGIEDIERLDGLDRLDGLGGFGGPAGSGEAIAGRARVPVPGGGRNDVLWWGYPLTAPAPFRLLVLATSTARLQRQRALRGARVAPGFGRHGCFPEAAEPGGRLPRLLVPRLLGRRQWRAVEPVAARVRELGCPIVEVHRPLVPHDPALTALNVQVSDGCAEVPHPPG
ncbi:PAS domain-containing protein [Streptomyces sp. 891-h]|uniref:PAS domain-containing protein n=1 Tax=Streptomyces sp. 891-h TaxID=2720714 RepID=UPI001FAA9633|nr:PAS domain-containing protein [Streptomyces sp. 891-h]UNZ16741.1 hypothetical protein HC362_06320 [Streptomyces sp. 891-h]